MFPSGVIAVVVVCLLAPGAQSAWAAGPERVEIEDLVSAAPVPKGFTVTRKDVNEGGKVVGTLLILTKEGSPTRGLVQIERREISAPPARVATLKAYINAAAATWQKQGYAVKARTLPKFETIDFAKPVAIDLDATKDGAKPVVTHMEVFFDRFAYQAMCASAGEDADVKAMTDWCKSVRSPTGGAATRPAR
jgi:hypothetical protein